MSYFLQQASVTLLGLAGVVFMYGLYKHGLVRRSASAQRSLEEAWKNASVGKATKNGKGTSPAREKVRARDSKVPTPGKLRRGRQLVPTDEIGDEAQTEFRGAWGGSGRRVEVASPPDTEINAAPDAAPPPSDDATVCDASADMAPTTAAAAPAASAFRDRADQAASQASSHRYMDMD